MLVYKLFLCVLTRKIYESIMIWWLKRAKSVWKWTGATRSLVYFRYLFFRHLGSAIWLITGHLETAQYNQWTHQLVDVSVTGAKTQLTLSDLFSPSLSANFPFKFRFLHVFNFRFKCRIYSAFKEMLISIQRTVKNHAVSWQTDVTCPHVVSNLYDFLLCNSKGGCSCCSLKWNELEWVLRLWSSKKDKKLL